MPVELKHCRHCKDERLFIDGECVYSYQHGSIRVNGKLVVDIPQCPKCTGGYAVRRVHGGLFSCDGCAAEFDWDRREVGRRITEHA